MGKNLFRIKKLSIFAAYLVINHQTAYLMKKTISLFATLLLISVGLKAQDSSDSDNYIFTHLGGSISVGTDGIGIDVAAPITPYVSVRAGVSFFPRIKYTKDDVKYTRNGIQGKGEVKAKLNKIDGKILFDAYPFGLKNSFHVTAGLFMGTSDIVTASFIEDPISPIGGGIAKMIDGAQWSVRPDAETGAIDLRLKANSVKPYLGIGFGRAIPKKRLNVAFDLGVQFHGTPRLEGYAQATTTSGTKYQWTELEADDFDFGESFHDDVEDALKIIHKVKVWPVLNIRLTGRFF